MLMWNIANIYLKRYETAGQNTSQADITHLVSLDF